MCFCGRKVRRWPTRRPGVWLVTKETAGGKPRSTSTQPQPSRYRPRPLQHPLFAMQRVGGASFFKWWSQAGHVLLTSLGHVGEDKGLVLKSNTWNAWFLNRLAVKTQFGWFTTPSPMKKVVYFEHRCLLEVPLDSMIVFTKFPGNPPNKTGDAPPGLNCWQADPHSDIQEKKDKHRELSATFNPQLYSILTFLSTWCQPTRPVWY